MVGLTPVHVALKELQCCCRCCELMKKSLAQTVAMPLLQGAAESREGGKVEVEG